MIRLKRVYERPAPDDGLRILVERLWPRGVTKEKAKLDLWMREIAPSDGLRRWYGHEAQKWPEFRERYVRELAVNRTAVEGLRRTLEGKAATFIYAARDAERNSAVVLKDYLEARAGPRVPGRPLDR